MVSRTHDLGIFLVTMLFAVVLLLVFSMVAESAHHVRREEEGLVVVSPVVRSNDGSLSSIYEGYDEAPLFDHWAEYAPHYERHLPKPCSQRHHGLLLANGTTAACEPVKLLEIGVQSGGSTRVWRRYYGDQLRYVGIDINPKCKRSESLEEHIAIEIGSQLDAAFLTKVCEDHGPFDVVIDDGGHTFEMINTTLHAMWPNDQCLKPHAVYAVEDLHTMVMCDRTVAGMHFCEDSHQFTELLGDLYHAMLYYWDSKSFKNHLKAPPKFHPVWGNKIIGIHLYDSLMFLQRGEAHPMNRLEKGTDKIPYERK